MARGNARSKNGDINYRFRQNYSYGGQWFPLFENLLSHDAYQILDTKAKTILMELLAHINNAEFKGEEKFQFAWCVCKTQCYDNTFHKAMLEFVRIGWIDCRPEDQPTQTWGGKWYRASDRWRTYQLTEGEKQKLADFEKAKVKRIAKGRKGKAQRLTVFFTRNHCGDSPRNHCGDT